MHEGGVVRSKLHSLEITKDARKPGHERTKVWNLDLSLWDGLDADRFRLGRSGHTRFRLGPQQGKSIKGPYGVRYDDDKGTIILTDLY